MRRIALRFIAVLLTPRWSDPKLFANALTAGIREKEAF